MKIKETERQGKMKNDSISNKLVINKSYYAIAFVIRRRRSLASSSCLRRSNKNKRN